MLSPVMSSPSLKRSINRWPLGPICRTRYVFANPSLGACRRRQLSSNVRRLTHR